MDNEPQKRQCNVNPKPYKVTMFLEHGITFEFRLAARNECVAKIRARDKWLNLYQCGPKSIKKIDAVEDNQPVRYIF